MNLRTLKYLIALDEHGHFGRAAEACFVSQPALSTQIKKLEEELGAQLVERRRKRVLLTPLGSEIARRARRIVRDAEELVELARSQQDPMAGQVRLGLIPTVGPYLLPHVVAFLKQRHPQLRCLLYEFQTLEILARLDRGELDAGLLALPLPSDALTYRVLFDEPFYLAVSPGHPLAAAGEAVALEQLRGETLMLLEDGHCLRDQALEVCGRADLREAPELQATSLETLRQMVASGLGVTLLPALARRSEDTVITLPLAPVPARTLVLAWRRSNPRTATLNLLADALREAVDQVVGLSGSLRAAAG